MIEVNRVALLHAVTGWYRARLLGHDILTYLYQTYRHELTGAAPDSPVSGTGAPLEAGKIRVLRPLAWHISEGRSLGAGECTYGKENIAG